MFIVKTINKSFEWGKKEVVITDWYFKCMIGGSYGYTTKIADAFVFAKEDAEALANARNSSRLPTDFSSHEHVVLPAPEGSKLTTKSSPPIARPVGLTESNKPMKKKRIVTKKETPEQAVEAVTQPTQEG